MVTGASDAELFRLRQILNIPKPGSGNRATYDELTADLMVTIWSAQSAYLTAFPAQHNGISWALWTQLALDLQEDPDHHAVWRQGPLTITLSLVRTDWTNVDEASRAPRRKVHQWTSR